MFYKKRKQRDATTLAHLLQDRFDMNINVNDTSSQYTWNSLTPYIVFFSALPIMVLSFSLANKSYIPCAEIFVLSLVMMGFCFIGLNDSHDSLTFVALSSHGFASLPVFLAKLPSIPVLTSALNFFIQPLVSVDLGLNVSLNLSLPALVHLLIPVLMIRLAMRDSWSGTYRIVVPHLVCFFWCTISTLLFPFTTWLSLGRATFGYLLSPLLLPLSVLFSILGFFYIFYQLLQTEMIGKVLVTGLLLAVPVLMSQTKLLFGKKGKTVSPQLQKIRMGVMILFSVLAVVPLFFIHIPAMKEKVDITLSYEDYKQLCLPETPQETIAPYQLRCRDLINTKVSWTGSVKDVKVVKVENTAESVIKSLPAILAEPLYCIYGSPIEDCDPDTMSAKALKHCQLITSTGRKCHLREHNQVSLSLTVMVGDTSIALDAGTSFSNTLMALRFGDIVEFSGTLVEAGSLSPSMKLKSVSCVSRVLAVMEETYDDVDEDVLFKLINEALALTFNFSFFPVLKYTP